ncbi:MAG: PEGA domain-containing protein [Myxococcota bacterium]|nr:PEGA domain-containing protein [Myxococcota bacterium]
MRFFNQLRSLLVTMIAHLCWVVFLLLSVDSYAQSKKKTTSVQERLLILVLDKHGVLAGRQNITDKLKQTMEKNLDIQVVSDEETFVVFDRNVAEMFSSCRGDPVCLARLVQNLDARYLLVVSSSKISESIVLGLRYVDLKERTTIGQAVHKVPSNADLHKEISKRLPDIVPKAMWRPYGSISVNIAQQRVQVFLDGQLVGISPLKKLERIKPGTRQLRFELDGYLPYTKSVLVQQGEVFKLDVQMTSEEKDNIPWWVWVSVGTVIVTGVAGGIWWSSERDIALCSSPSLSQCP